MSLQDTQELVLSPYSYKVDSSKFDICYDETSQIIVYIHKEQQILFFHTLTDVEFAPAKLSTPITFIPRGPVLSVSFSVDRRFISLVRTPNSIEIFNLVDPKHTCVKVCVRSKESIIPNGVCWLHSKREMKSKMVFSPILVVATTKSLSFYDVSLKGASLIKSVKLSVSALWCNWQNQLAVAAESGTGRLYIYTVKEMGVQKLQSLTLSEPPSHATTQVASFYRATYLLQYSASRGYLFLFAFSTREMEFKFFNTVALPERGPAVLSVSDNLLFLHFPAVLRSFFVDVAEVPYESSRIPAGNAVHAVHVSSIPAGNEDPAFHVSSTPAGYASVEVCVRGVSLGLELESTFPRLFRGELDGRVHGCLDSSGCVREMAGVSSGMAGVSSGDYLTHLNDHCVVGNSLASVTELIRTAGRPLKLRFERGVPASDPYLYRGDVPIVRVCEVEGEAV
ncbi:hypothetical protein WA588_000768, partial [Blastocystis sp. NMH]